MSNFMCNKCNITNEDSNKGYIAGCACRKPDVSSNYRCMVKTKSSTGIIVTTFKIINFDKKENKWNKKDSEKILRWEINKKFS